MTDRAVETVAISRSLSSLSDIEFSPSALCTEAARNIVRETARRVGQLALLVLVERTRHDTGGKVFFTIVREPPCRDEKLSGLTCCFL